METKGLLKKASLEGYLGLSKLYKLLEHAQIITQNAKVVFKNNLENIEKDHLNESELATEYIKALTLLKNVEENISSLHSTYQESFSQNMQDVLKVINESTRC